MSLVEFFVLWSFHLLFYKKSGANKNNLPCDWTNTLPWSNFFYGILELDMLNLEPGEAHVAWMITRFSNPNLLFCVEENPRLNPKIQDWTPDPWPNQPEIIQKVGLNCRTMVEQWHFLTWLQAGKVTPLRVARIMTRKNVELVILRGVKLKIFQTAS